MILDIFRLIPSHIELMGRWLTILQINFKYDGWAEGA